MLCILHLGISINGVLTYRPLTYYNPCYRNSQKGFLFDNPEDLSCNSNMLSPRRAAFSPCAGLFVAQLTSLAAGLVPDQLSRRQNPDSDRHWMIRKLPEPPKIQAPQHSWSLRTALPCILPLLVAIVIVSPNPLHWRRTERTRSAGPRCKGPGRQPDLPHLKHPQKSAIFL